MCWIKPTYSPSDWIQEGLLREHTELKEKYRKCDTAKNFMCDFLEGCDERVVDTALKELGIDPNKFKMINWREINPLQVKDALEMVKIKDEG